MVTRSKPRAKRGQKVVKAEFMNNNQQNTSTSTNKVAAGQMITTKFGGLITDLSNFDGLTDDQLYEQLWVWEPEVGSSIDRVSTLVSESFRGLYLHDVGPTLEAKEAKCLKEAKKIYESMQVETLAETYTEVLLRNGNLLIDYRDVMKTSILPNQFVAFIDDLALLNTMSTTRLITDPKWLTVNEKKNPSLDQYQIPIGQYLHVKYKDTPCMSYDIMGRNTYGIYSISPLHRCIISTWWKRQIILMDVLNRARNVPREHHQISADMFSLDNYTGTPEQQHAAQMADAQAFITSYVNSIKEQAVDQGYATLDTVKIQMINGNTNHLQSNDLLKQIQNDIYTGLNVPSSIVNGKDAGSYASELVVSNYVTAKVIQLAKKIKFIILKMIRDRLELIDPTLPVDQLDIKLELVLAMNKLEQFRQLSLMAAAGVFTEDEIRAIVAYEALTDEQKKHIVSTGKITIGDPADTDESTVPGEPDVTGISPNNVAANQARAGDNKDGTYPDTPQSQSSHTRDASEEILRT
jgi:hypothetical protein